MGLLMSYWAEKAWWAAIEATPPVSTMMIAARPDRTRIVSSHSDYRFARNQAGTVIRTGQSHFEPKDILTSRHVAERHLLEIAIRCPGRGSLAGAVRQRIAGGLHDAPVLRNQPEIDIDVVR